MNATTLLRTFGLARAGAPLPTADLESVWWFEDGSGTTVSDSSGNGVDATISGSSNGAWVPEGYSLPDGNIIHGTSYGAMNHTVVIAFRLDTVVTATGRWLWGWDTGGIRMTLQPASGFMRFDNRVTVGGTNFTMNFNPRPLTDNEWYIAAVTAEANANLISYLWVDGTRHSQSMGIGTPINATNNVFRFKGSSSPEFTFAFSAHYSRALGVAELEQVVAALKARASGRGITWA